MIYRRYCKTSHHRTLNTERILFKPVCSNRMPAFRALSRVPCKMRMQKFCISKVTRISVLILPPPLLLLPANLLIAVTQILTLYLQIIYKQLLKYYYSSPIARLQIFLPFASLLYSFIFKSNEKFILMSCHLSRVLPTCLLPR